MIDHSVVSVSDEPASRALCQDKRQTILAAWRAIPSGGVKGSTLSRMTAAVTSARFPDLHVGHLDACRPEERLMIGGMARDDGRLARPMHADDVDPVRIIDKQFGQRLHVVSVPGFAVTFHYVSNGFFRRRVLGNRVRVGHEQSISG